MSNLALIQPQTQSFRTAQNQAWLDGFPIIGVPAAAGVEAGAENVGNGGLSVAAASFGTALGAHVLTVTDLVGGLTRFTVADPEGSVTGNGVTGLPIYAGGLTLTLAQGATPFAVGDSFAIAVLPAPLDISGLVFDLDSRLTAGSATLAFQATSAPADGSVATIAAGTTGGNIAMRLSRPAMARQPPGAYPYNILAYDPVADPDRAFPVLVFCGVIRHAAVYQPQD